MDVFAQCHKVNDLLLEGNEAEARNEVILLLENLREDGLEYSPLVNRLIRDVGLFPYLNPTTASWQERYIHEVFKVDVGDDEPITLHREQSRLLNALLADKSIAVSAPTSFGKSFVIDSFVSIRRPTNVVILVPTIALADETRRRLQKKFASTYKIITTADQSLDPKNIFIFPQERAISYFETLDHIDILIVDEFYKASVGFDKDRSPALVRAIISLSKIADQRYFLAPNIDALKGNAFTEGMEFLRLDFNTVFLERNDLFLEIGKDEKKKSDVLLRILGENPGKILIYAGTYTNIEKLSNLLMTNLDTLKRPLLNQFQSWLSKNYDPNWALANLVVTGVGIHNGRLHRSLSQIQIRMFEEEGGIDRMISTSSIIEGVNTSAEIVVLWSNKNGIAKIDDFTFKNIIGRGGRMFRHFVGKIFVLEKPPEDAHTQLELDIPEELLGMIDEESLGFDLTSEQTASRDQYKADMLELVGPASFEYFQENDLLQSSDSSLIRKIAGEIKTNTDSWNGLSNLNSTEVNRWDHYLYKLINLQPGAWGIQYRKYVAFVKILSRNWDLSIPELLQELYEFDISIEKFFELERNTTFRLASLLGDV
jgi:RAD3-like DEAD/DEAH box helicase